MYLKTKCHPRTARYNILRAPTCNAQAVTGPPAMNCAEAPGPQASYSSRISVREPTLHDADDMGSSCCRCRGNMIGKQRHPAPANLSPDFPGRVALLLSRNLVHYNSNVGDCGKLQPPESAEKLPATFSPPDSINPSSLTSPFSSIDSAPGTSLAVSYLHTLISWHVVELAAQLSHPIFSRDGPKIDRRGRRRAQFQGLVLGHCPRKCLRCHRIPARFVRQPSHL